MLGRGKSSYLEAEIVEDILFHILTSKFAIYPETYIEKGWEKVFPVRVHIAVWTVLVDSVICWFVSI